MYLVRNGVGKVSIIEILRQFTIVRILFWLISEVEGSSLLDRDHWLETGLIKTDTRTTLKLLLVFKIVKINVNLKKVK